MPLRNPFRRTAVPTDADPVSTSNGSSSHRAGTDGDSEHSGRSSSALSIKSSRTEPDEYQMSVVNDSGVYLPPSPPPERKGFWGRSHSSTATSTHRSMLSDNEQFSISRESFESYRRSFDISARSPVAPPLTPPRHSVDARPARLPVPRPHAPVDRRPTMEEAPFEDVGLNDEVKPKRRSIFGRFGDSGDHGAASPSTGTSTHHAFLFPGRRRGHSGQGAELHSMPRPVNSGPSGIQVGN
ncbi:MAG: hypothetical protein M1815_004595 [Lichina confinis]|nr:MAG: hypothetical protein M1815_004595 [Lichina confinis]